MDTIVKSVFGVLGAAASYMWGGFPMVIKLLLVLMVIDFVTGLLAGWAERRLSSRIGRQGIARKILTPIMVSVAHFADVALGTGSVFRDGVAFFYVVNEVLSIVENAGRAGLPIPDNFRKAIEILREKGEDKK